LDNAKALNFFDFDGLRQAIYTMDNFIFDKTDKGREEIITRKYRLASRLRSLLVLIDGKKTNVELLSKVAGLGLDMQSLVDLAEGEFIEGVAMVPGSDPAIPAPAPVRLPNNTMTAAQGASLEAANASKNKGMISPEAYLILQSFLIETIRSAIGLRGFTLQLKVERASTLADFEALREPYLAAVKKAKGNEAMASLGERLDQLLLDAARSM
jgi:hypothetical protein